MIFDTFVENLEASFKGKFGKADLNEIKNFIHQNELTTDQIQNWYNVVKRNHKVEYLPRFGQLMDYWDQAKFKRSGEARLHPQSPLQALYKYKDRSAKWILDKCKEIRRSQDKRELMSWEMSFLAIWEDLTRVIEGNEEEAKQMIIDNGDNQLYTKVDLSDLEPEYKPIEIKPERKNETVNIKDVYDEIPI